MRAPKISIEAGTTVEEMLQIAERRGPIELRFEWKARVPVIKPTGAHDGPLNWRPLPNTRGTIVVRNVEAAYAVMRAIDQALAAMVVGRKGETNR